MICPFNQSTIISEQTNVESENTDYIENIIIKQVMTNMECKKENCAVWRDGRCHYND